MQRYSRPFLGGAVLATLFVTSWAGAFPFYLDTWRTIYPASTLPDRMALQAGTECRTCHQPPGFGNAGNCYREDLIEKLGLGFQIDQAILLLEGDDSDGDGVANGVEFLAQHVDFPEHIGYNAGLVGPLGVGPCGPDPNSPVSGVLETPPGDPGCPNPQNGCDTDVDGDCIIGQADLGVLLAAFGSQPGDANWNPLVDYDGDNLVGQGDLGQLLAEFGHDCN